MTLLFNLEQLRITYLFFCARFITQGHQRLLYQKEYYVPLIKLHSRNNARLLCNSSVTYACNRVGEALRRLCLLNEKRCKARKARQVILWNRLFSNSLIF
jgi:hypothetical protein